MHETLSPYSVALYQQSHSMSDTFSETILRLQLYRMEPMAYQTMLHIDTQPIPQFNQEIAQLGLGISLTLSSNSTNNSVKYHRVVSAMHTHKLLPIPK